MPGSLERSHPVAGPAVARPRGCAHDRNAAGMEERFEGMSHPRSVMWPTASSPHRQARTTWEAWDASLVRSAGIPLDKSDPLSPRGAAIRIRIPLSTQCAQRGGGGRDGGDRGRLPRTEAGSIPLTTQWVSGIQYRRGGDAEGEGECVAVGRRYAREPPSACGISPRKAGGDGIQIPLSPSKRGLFQSLLDLRSYVRAGVRAPRFSGSSPGASHSPLLKEHRFACDVGRNPPIRVELAVLPFPLNRPAAIVGDL